MIISQYDNIISLYDKKIGEQKRFTQGDLIELGRALILSGMQKEKVQEGFQSLNSLFSADSSDDCEFIAKAYIELEVDRLHLKIEKITDFFPKKSSKQKKVSKDTLFLWLESVLDIQTAPTQELEEVYSEMRAFCEKTWDEKHNDLAMLRTYYARIPFVYEFIQGIKRNYKQWPNLQTKNKLLEHLKDKIYIQQHNLLTIVRLLQHEKNQDFLFYPPKKLVKDNFQDIASGDVSLEKEHINELKHHFQHLEEKRKAA